MALSVALDGQWLVASANPWGGCRLHPTFSLPEARRPAASGRLAEDLVWPFRHVFLQPYEELNQLSLIFI